MAKKKHTPVRNEPLYRAMMEMRRSSAASKHTPRPLKGSRGANKQKAIRDQH